MTGRKGRRRLLGWAVLSSTIGWWLFMAAPAHASVGGLETGVWWRDETGTATLPAPPQVPPGGLWVSSDPSGPSAISAVRFTVPNSDSFPTLTLTIDKLTVAPSSPVTPGTVPVLACVISSSWTPPSTSPGEWNNRPSYNCAAGTVSGNLSPDGKSVVFDLSLLPPAESYNLAIIPAPGSGTVSLPAPPTQVPAPLPTSVNPSQTAQWPTFDITFDPVNTSNVAVLPPPAPPTSAPAVPAAPAPTATSTAPAASGNTRVGLPFAVAPVITVPPSQPSLAPAVATPTARASDVATPTALVPVSSPALALPAAKASERSASRVLMGIIVCVLGVWAWRLLSSDATLAGDGPVISLYDPPPAKGDAGLRRRWSTGTRTGMPPALR